MKIEEVIEKLWVEKIDKLSWQVASQKIVIDNLQRQIFNLECKPRENQKYNKSKIKNESAREKAELRKKIKHLEEELAYEKEYSRKLYTALDELMTRMWYKLCFWQLQLRELE